MRYLTVGDVVKAHSKALRHGESEGMQFGMLESAVLRPQTTIDGQDAYPDLHTKAAVLFYSLCNNHAFAAANKRTAVLSVQLFFNVNGWDLKVQDIDLYHLALDTATKMVEYAEIAATFKDWTEPLPLPED